MSSGLNSNRSGYVIGIEHTVTTIERLHFRGHAGREMSEKPRLVAGGFHLPPIHLTPEHLSSGAAIQFSNTLSLHSFLNASLTLGEADDLHPIMFPFLPRSITPYSHMSLLHRRISFLPFLPTCKTLLPLFRSLCPHFVSLLLTSSSFSTHVEPTSDPDSRYVTIASVTRHLLHSSVMDCERGAVKGGAVRV